MYSSGDSGINDLWRPETISADFGGCVGGRGFDFTFVTFAVSSEVSAPDVLIVV